MNNNDISLLVSSCDKYSDLWPLFFEFFCKNWSDCPFDKYILTNNIKEIKSDFKPINVGEDISWSDNLLFALDKINTPYIFIFLDDVLINKKVDNLLLSEILDDFEYNNGQYLKFLSQPKSNYNANSSYFMSLPIGSQYRATAVFALWKVETLKKILRSGENAWEFEEFGSIRSDVFDNFYVTKENFFAYVHTVVRGKFLKSAYREIIKVDPKFEALIKRDINTSFFEFKIQLKVYRHKLFNFLIPMNKRRSVRKLLSFH